MPRKNYNGVWYDTDKDYTTEIQKAANGGNNAYAAWLETQRNAKIAGEGMDYEQTSNYTKYLPKSDVAYDSNTDYMQLMNDAAGRGDYEAAWNYERQNNAKIMGEGLDGPITSTYAEYDPSRKYKYDPLENEEYQRFSAEMDALYKKIMDREPFSYDAESDPLYQMYREQYTKQGRAAMRDTMGQAAALTGGYGNTYAQGAGEQAFAEYLGRLNDVLPELYGAAYDRYNGETSKLTGLYSMASGAAGDAYDRGYNEWSTKVGLQRADEETEYNRRFAEEQRDYERRYAEEQREYERRQAAYAQQQQEIQSFRSYLVALISAGYVPTAADLQAAGMTQAQANALRNEYLRSFNSGSGGGRSGSGRSSGRSSGGGGSYVAPTTPPAPKEYSDTPMDTNRYSGLQRQIVEYAKKGNVTKVKQLLAENKKSMTKSQYDSIVRLLSQMGVKP